MRTWWKSLTILALFAAGFVSSPALGSVPKVVVAENFGAVW
jgi:hypothetical protein